MGSPAFAVPALDALIDAGHDIAAVYCQPPRPAGRGNRPRPTAVAARAEALGLAVRNPIDFRGARDRAAFALLDADVAVVAAYGLILPQALLDAPRHGCLNIHASLLPRWRGAAPVHRAILAGDGETGISIMQMEAGLDTGPVLRTGRLPIGPTVTTGALEASLAALGARLIVETLAELPGVPVPQPETGAVYAAKIDKAEARIDWTRPAEVVDRQIRGLSPFPGAWCLAGDTRIKLVSSVLAKGTGHPGTVLNATTVACGTDAVTLTALQRAGKGVTDAETFLRGFPLPPGTVLS